MTPRKAPAPRPLASALTLLLAGLAPGQDPAEADPDGGPRLELTLEDAIQIAMENNIDLELEHLRTEVARFDHLGSWGAFDPTTTFSATVTDREAEAQSGLVGTQRNTQSLSSSLRFPLTTGGRIDLTYSRDNVKTDDPFAVFDISTADVVTVAVTQPLLRGAWRRFATTDQREAEVALRRQEARLEQERQRVLLDVYEAYWNLVGAAEELKVRKFAVELGEKQHERENRRLQEGVGTKVEVLQAKTNVAQLDEQRLRADFDRRTAEDVLRTLLFQSPEGELLERASEWDLPIDPLTPLPEVGQEPTRTWGTSLNLALANRPELRQGLLDIATAEVRLRRARSNRLPGLDLSLSAASVGFDADPAEALTEALGYEFPTIAGSLAFDFPLRNRTARYAQRAARLGVAVARLSYQKVEVSVLSGVRQAVRNLHFTQEAITAAVKSYELADQQLAAEQARYGEGLSTTFQVLEFQRDLSESKSSLTTARSNFAKALAQLRHAEGLLGVDG